jgi:hypothetical protein
MGKGGKKCVASPIGRVHALHHDEHKVPKGEPVPKIINAVPGPARIGGKWPLAHASEDFSRATWHGGRGRGPCQYTKASN